MWGGRECLLPASDLLCLKLLVFNRAAAQQSLQGSGRNVALECLRVYHFNESFVSLVGSHGSWMGLKRSFMDVLNLIKHINDFFC